MWITYPICEKGSQSSEREPFYIDNFIKLEDWMGV